MKRAILITEDNLLALKSLNGGDLDRECLDEATYLVWTDDPEGYNSIVNEDVFFKTYTIVDFSTMFLVVEEI